MFRMQYTCYNAWYATSMCDATYIYMQCNMQYLRTIMHTNTVCYSYIYMYKILYASLRIKYVVLLVYLYVLNIVCINTRKYDVLFAYSYALNIVRIIAHKYDMLRVYPYVLNTICFIADEYDVLPVYLCILNIVHVS